MYFFMRGFLIVWLFTGLQWGAFMWVFGLVFGAIWGRELSTRVPVHEPSALPERLGEAVKRFGYVAEQQSPDRFVCRPKRGLGRFFECAKLHVILQDGVAEVTGPAVVLKGVRKKLLGGAPPVASPTGTN
jgi:hypothetical protein